MRTVSARSGRPKSSWAGVGVVVQRLQKKLEPANAIVEGLPSTILAAVSADAGRSEGISAEQILRAIVVQRMTGWAYGDLAFHVQDSSMLRRFCQLGPGDAFSEAILREAIQRVTPQTVELLTGHLATHGF